MTPDELRWKGGGPIRIARLVCHRTGTQYPPPSCCTKLTLSATCNSVIAVVDSPEGCSVLILRLSTVHEQRYRFREAV